MGSIKLSKMEFTAIFLSSLVLASEQSPLHAESLPINPCSSHQCPADQECQLVRLPCLFLCDLVPTCRNRKPLHKVGRETAPSTIQYQVQTSRNMLKNRLGLFSEESPPDLIKELVKGLSTEEHIQRPYLSSLPRAASKGSSVMRSRKYSHNAPLVLLSRMQNKQSDTFGERALNYAVRDPIEEILMKKPFILIKGPGMQKSPRHKTMEINFPIEANAIDQNAPKLGVMSMYDLKPWDTKEDEELSPKIAEDHNTNLTYREAMEILDASIRSKQSMLRKSSNEDEIISIFEELGKHLSALPSLAEIFRYSRHNQQEHEDEIVPKDGETEITSLHYDMKH